MNVLRSIVLGILLVGAGVLLVFGPRGHEALPTDRVIIKYWEKWTGKEGEAVQQLVREYNDTQGKADGIYVQCLTTSQIDKKTLVAIAAGTPPDVAGLWDYNLVQYAALDALEPLDGLMQESDYKPVYWKMCTWDGHLYALVSTPATVALHYHKKVFLDNADKLRAAGLDPTRPPETIDELDAYSKALEIVDASGHVVRAGTLPREPGWFLHYISFWWGKDIWDEKTGKFQLTDPQVIKAFDWVASYSRRLGKDATAEFQSGLGTFATPQNGFFYDPTATGAYPRVVMEQQGPWMANFIYNYDPKISTLVWPRVKNADANEPDEISPEEWAQTPEERKKNYEWAVAPFPSAVPGMKDVTYATCDILVIPKGGKHVPQAKKFLQWYNSQHAMEEICLAHSKNSPLSHVSDYFMTHHTNPYIDVFERLANSPNAFTTPKLPINQEATDELKAVIDEVALLKKPAVVALGEAQVRLQASYDDFVARQRARHAAGTHVTGALPGGIEQ